MKIHIVLITVVMFAFFFHKSEFAQTGQDIVIDKKTKQEYAEKVKDAFLHAWNGYKEYAYGMDDLLPLSKTGKNWYDESLVMTPVDAFDTMLLLGMYEEAEKTKELIFERLHFDHDMYVSVFEITIRLMGGLLSAYTWDGDERFLMLAEDLAVRLLPAFDSPTEMPYKEVNLKTGEVRDPVSNPAEIGTLMLEFGQLTMITESLMYYDIAKIGTLEVLERVSEIGLIGTSINVESGEWVEQESHVSGMIDSYYEYLLKAYLLFGDEDFKIAYEKCISAVNEHVAYYHSDELWYAHVDMHTGEVIETQFGSLDAFFPAVLALGGDIKRGEKLQESCYKMWNEFGIEPEQYNFVTKEVYSPVYLLRPENIESAYYLYHFTKDDRYVKMGMEYYDSIEKYCKTDIAYCELADVRTKKQHDAMQSFFLAETLKYLYLLFEENTLFKFDEVIYNTEAHPFKIFTFE